MTLIGTLDAAARAELSQHRLGDRVSIVGQQDHAATIAAMRRADLLLLVANTTDGAEATVPGKLFEYLAVGRPVLAIAPSDSASADVIAETRAGWLARPATATRSPRRSDRRSVGRLRGLTLALSRATIGAS